MATVQLPTLAINGVLELNHVSHRQSGYGHKTITVELIYKGEKKCFSHTTNNMSGYDDAMDLDYEEEQKALYDLISYSIEDAVAEWTQEVDYEEINKFLNYLKKTMKKNNLFPLLLTAEQREHIEKESERKKVSKAEIVRRLIDSDIEADIITEAEKANERINAEADTASGTILKEYSLNEFGKFIYEVNFEIKHYPTPADPETGWGAGYEVTSVNVELLKIYDTEGDLVPFTKEQKSKIENSFKKLEYEIV